MKTKEIVIMTLLAVAACNMAPAQEAKSKVDQAVQQMDKAARIVCDDWKYSDSLPPEVEQAESLSQRGYDDSRWKTHKIGELYKLDYFWMRKAITIPERYLGKPVSGPCRLLLTVNNGGHLWVNGVSKGYCNWSGEFELSQSARPGDTYLVVIKAINTSGQMGLVRAELDFPAFAAERATLEGFALSLKVGQKLLSFDTYQTSSNKSEDPGIDRSTHSRAEKVRLAKLLEEQAGRLDLAALKSGDMESFNRSLERARQALAPVSRFAKSFILFFDANAHIDAAWLWREKETVQVTRNTFASVLNMMNQRPDFTYTQSQAALYDWMERLYPDLFKGIQKRVAEGRWELVGGMWVEPDCNLPSGESWMRHLLYAKRYFRSRFGREIATGWNPDSFGYTWTMPMLYRQAGIDAFITQKIGWNDTNVFPHRLFWWEGPDGSRILTYFPFDYVSTVEDPFRLVDWVRQYEANTGLRKLMILFGVGDHGGGPSLEMLARIDRLRSLAIYPSIEYGTASQYLSWVKKQDLSRVPVWKDELYLEYHQGTFTTQAKNKKLNRESEVLLTNAEKFTTLATTTGADAAFAGNAALEEAWRKVLFNQFHDILPGSSIREVYIDSAESYAEVGEIGGFELRQALNSIAAAVDTSALGDDTPVIVFNPLSWERSDPTFIPLHEGDFSEYAVFDHQGHELPSQLLPLSRTRRQLLFVARDVPSLGYRTYTIRKQKPRASATGLRVGPAELENDFFKVTLDPATGWVGGIKDKRSGKEILGGPGNELYFLEDKPAQYDAWNIGLTGARYPSAFRKLEVVESGPVRVVLRASRDYLKPGVKKEFPTEDFPTTFVSQDVILYAGLDRIDFRTDVDWWEEHTMLKVAFPLSVSAPAATFEIPFGSITRSTGMTTSWEKAKVEVPALRWADLSGSDSGVSLLNNGKYGHDVKGSTIRLSLLRSPTDPDPTADRGKHSISYALYPHAGTWKQAQTVRRGYEFNHPLLPVMARKHGGTLPPSFSFVRLEPDNLVLTGLKKAEEGNDWVIQWVETRGEECVAHVTLHIEPVGACLSNFLEEDRSETTPLVSLANPEALRLAQGQDLMLAGAPGVEGSWLLARTKKNSVVTVKLRLPAKPKEPAKRGS